MIATIKVPSWTRLELQGCSGGIGLELGSFYTRPNTIFVAMWVH